MVRPKVYDEDLRRRLIASAAGVIASEGVDALALRPLADQAGTSTNAVYTLFGGREALIGAVLDEAREGFSRAQEGVPETDDAVVDLIGLGHAYRAWAVANPALYEVLMGARVAPSEGEHWSADRIARPLVAAVRRAVDQRRVEEGRSVEEIAGLLWAGVHGVVSLEIGRWSRRAPAELDLLFADLLDAIGRQVGLQEPG